MHAYLIVAQAPPEAGLRIDWTTMPTYNTVMAVAAGAGLVMLVSGLYALVGLGAVLFPLALKDPGRPSTARSVVGWSWALAGLVFLLFGAMNFFTHIGLIVNTM